MKRTIYLLDELDAHIERYLREHPEETVSSIAQRALKKELLAREPKDLAPLLELAGFAKPRTTLHDPTNPRTASFSEKQLKTCDA